VDQIISGTVINIFATGLTSYLDIKSSSAANSNISTNPAFSNPGRTHLVKNSFSGSNSVQPKYVRIRYVYHGHHRNYRTFLYPLGTALACRGGTSQGSRYAWRKCLQTRYMAVVLSGMVAGFGGAFFSLGSVGRFEQVMTAGRGFIALAGMIFGKYTPVGFWAPVCYSDSLNRYRPNCPSSGSPFLPSYY
jgi:simple sugar transport system permease protein